MRLNRISAVTEASSVFGTFPKSQLPSTSKTRLFRRAPRGVSPFVEVCVVTLGLIQGLGVGSNRKSGS